MTQSLLIGSEHPLPFSVLISISGSLALLLRVLKWSFFCASGFLSRGAVLRVVTKCWLVEVLVSKLRGRLSSKLLRQESQLLG